MVPWAGAIGFKGASPTRMKPHWRGGRVKSPLAPRNPSHSHPWRSRIVLQPMEGPDIRSQTLPEGTYILWAPPARGLKGLLSFGRSSDGGERLKALARCARLRARPNPPLPPSARFPPPADEVPPPVDPRRSPCDQQSPRSAAAALAGTLPPAGFSAPASYSLAGGACLLVRYGLAQAAGLGLSHATPNVHHEPSTRTACVFTGVLAPPVMRCRLAAMPPLAAPPCYPCCPPCCCLPPPAARLVCPTSQTATCIPSFPSHFHCRLAACPMPPLL